MFRTQFVTHDILLVIPLLSMNIYDAIVDDFL